MILQDETLFNLTNENDGDKSSSSPPTKVITVKQHFTIADHDEMLSLAQEKFDHLRQKSRERASSTRYSGRASAIRRRSVESQEEKKISQLLSSLLYLSLMMHKVDDMKQILEANSGTLYNEWQTLFESLHSPVFHLRERCMHNERVKKTYRRKSKYKAMFEEAKASVMRLEGSTEQLGHALSKMSEENFNSQAMLADKCNVQFELSSTQKQVQQLLENVQRQENEILLAKEAREKLESSLGMAKKQNNMFEQKILDDEAVAIKAAKEMADLCRDTKDLQAKLQNAEQQLAVLEKEREFLHDKIQQQADEHELLVDEKEKLLVDRNANDEKLQSVIKSLQDERKEIEFNFNSESKSLESSLSDMAKELGITTAKMQSFQLAAANLRSDLESKSNTLEKVLETNRLMQLCQSELRETTVSQQKEIDQLKERTHNNDLKLAEATHRLNVKVGEHSIIRTEFDRQVLELEAKAKEHQQHKHQLETDLGTARGSELKLTNEKSMLESRFREMTFESKAYEAEKNILKNVLEKMRITMENSIRCASQSKEDTDAKMKETESGIISASMELAKAQAENDILKATIASHERKLSEALQTNMESEEKSALVLQETILKHNAEKDLLSKAMNTINISGMEEIRVKAKSDQLASEENSALLFQEITLKHNQEIDEISKEINSIKISAVDEVRVAKEEQADAELKVKAMELEMGKMLKSLATKTKVEHHDETIPSLSPEQTCAKKIVNETMSSAIETAFKQRHI